MSSSAHTQLLPWLARWPYVRLDDDRRKTLEATLHATAALALALHMRRDLLRDAANINARRAAVIALALGPPALAGYTLERPIERHLGGPRAIAAGLLAGSAAMVLAEIRALANGRHVREMGAAGELERSTEEANAWDGLALGLAQVAALIPGISRSGATLAAARARGFSRPAAQALSWHAGLPVLLGAGALKAVRLRARGLARGERATLAAGAAGAAVSTWASTRLLDRPSRAGQSLLPYALYRCVLAAVVLACSQ